MWSRLCVHAPAASAAAALLEQELAAHAFDSTSAAFSVLAASPSFIEEFWERRPFVLRTCHHRSQSGINWTGFNWTAEQQIDLLSDNDIWTASSQHQFYSHVGGISFTGDHPVEGESASKMQKHTLRRLRRGSTWTLNHGEVYFAQLRALVAAAQHAFLLPAAVNVFVSSLSEAVCAPLHTDRMNSFVVQTEGSKRWRVFEPPTVGALPVIDAGSGTRFCSPEIPQLAEPSHSPVHS